MTLLEFLQASDSTFAIVGGVVAIAYWVLNRRRRVIEGQRRHVPERWTNEGNVDGEQHAYIHLDLRIEHGEISGSLVASEETYGVYFTAGWPRGKLVVSHMHNYRLPPVAQYRVSLEGNDNRLRLRAFGGVGTTELPSETVLWPVPNAAR